MSKYQLKIHIDLRSLIFEKYKDGVLIKSYNVPPNTISPLEWTSLGYVHWQGDYCFDCSSWYSHTFNSSWCSKSALDLPMLPLTEVYDYNVDFDLHFSWLRDRPLVPNGMGLAVTGVTRTCFQTRGAELFNGFSARTFNYFWYIEPKIPSCCELDFSSILKRL